VFDLILKNATIANGRRVPLHRGDVCIKQGKIAAIENCAEDCGAEILDVKGKIVAPGFIDIHSHSDTIPLMNGQNPQSKIFQGVTLEITGNCGVSHLPMNETNRADLTDYFFSSLPSPIRRIPLPDDSISNYAAHVAKHPPATNYGALIGHGTLRAGVMGFDMRAPTVEELSQMKKLLDRELERGAFGLSLGLIYSPSQYAKHDEFTALARVLKKHGAILAVHLRNEGARLFEAVDEVLDIAKETGVHLQISHLKLMGTAQWHNAERLLSHIEEARQRGAVVTCDQYPYPATATGLSALVPGWAQAGGVKRLVERMQSPSTQLLEEIWDEMESRGGPDCVMIVSTSGQMPEADGKTIAELSGSIGLNPVETVAECLRRCSGVVSCIYFSLHQDDVLTLMKDMNIAIGSDGTAYAYEEAPLYKNLHPRNFGAFPRFLQTVREHNLMPLEDAVYKMTGLPASVLHLKDRGFIDIGKTADLTIFDPIEITDRCTYTDSAIKPLGIEHVLVGGNFVVKNSLQTGSVGTGRVLTHAT
jgi:N-acyl-D-amino-acid deacylase